MCLIYATYAWQGHIFKHRHLFWENPSSRNHFFTFSFSFSPPSPQWTLAMVHTSNNGILWVTLVYTVLKMLLARNNVVPAFPTLVSNDWNLSFETIITTNSQSNLDSQWSRHLALQSQPCLVMNSIPSEDDLFCPHRHRLLGPTKNPVPR